MSVSHPNNDAINKKVQNFHAFIKRAQLDAKPHQTEGVRWCIANEIDEDPLQGVQGGIVSDEMGLGKTIMMIGLMIANFKNQTLIVLPVALVDQWKREIIRTTGHTPLVFHGSNRHENNEAVKTAPIVLTTYGMVASSSPDGLDTSQILHDISWDRVIFDEAHHLRNIHTRRHIGAVALHAKIRWLVTGTPIQNRKKDFYALCAILGLIPEFYTETDNLPFIMESLLLKRTKTEVGIKIPEKRGT